MLHLFQYGSLALEVVGTLLLYAELFGSTAFADCLHGLTEGFFLWIHDGNIGCGVAALFNILLACLLERLIVVTVEQLLEQFYIVFLWDEFGLCQFLCTCHNFFLGGELYIFCIFHNSMLGV